MRESAEPELPGSRIRRLHEASFHVLFGSAWIGAGLSLLHRGSTRTVLTGWIALFVVLLITGRVWLRRTEASSASQLLSDDALRAQRMVRAVNIIQWVAIATAVAILILLALPQYIPVAVGILVGLHMFPLADTFRDATYRVTGILLILWSGAMLLDGRHTWMPGVCALGIGLLLMLSAAGVALQTIRRRSVTAA